MRRHASDASSAGLLSLLGRGPATTALQQPDTAAVLDGGLAIIWEPTDKDCQRLAEAWSTDPRTLSVAKSAHGCHFPARSYLLYWVPAQAAKIPP